jgi:hypothetical protein
MIRKWRLKRESFRAGPEEEERKARKAREGRNKACEAFL